MPENDEQLLDYNLTRAQVGEMLGVDAQTVRRWEGNVLPRPARYSFTCIRHSRTLIERAMRDVIHKNQDQDQEQLQTA